MMMMRVMMMKLESKKMMMYNMKKMVMMKKMTLKKKMVMLSMKNSVVITMKNQVVKTGHIRWMQRSTVVLERRKKALRKTRIPSRLMFYYWKFKSSKNPCKKSCFLWAGGLELSTRTSVDKGKPRQVACISLKCVTCVRWVDLSEKAKSVYVDFGIEYIRQIFLFCYIKGMLCV